MLLAHQAGRRSLPFTALGLRGEERGGIRTGERREVRLRAEVERGGGGEPGAQGSGGRALFARWLRVVAVCGGRCRRGVRVCARVSERLRAVQSEHS